MYKFIFFLFGLMTFLVSCQNDNEESTDTDRRIAVRFGGVETRATDTRFESGDTIGIFAVNRYSKSDSLCKTGNYADNYQYKYVEHTDSGFVACNKHIYQFKNKKLDLVYYDLYPYRESYGPTFSFKVKLNQSYGNNYTRSDLAFQRTESTDTIVALKLDHLLANIHISLTGTDLNQKDISVSLLNIYTKVNVDLNRNRVATDTTDIASKASEVVCKQGSKTNSSCDFYAIVAPQLFEQGKRYLSITIDGETTYLNVPTTRVVSRGRCLTQNYMLTTDIKSGDVSISFVGEEQE